MKRFFSRFVCLGAILAFLISQLLSPASSIAQQASNSVSTINGNFDSIVIDFKESSEVLSNLPSTLSGINQTFGLTPSLNSEFSAADHVYVVSGLTDWPTSQKISFVEGLRESFQQSSTGSQVEFIEPNYIYETSGFTVDDPDYNKQWNLSQINIEDAWSKGINGKGVTVAVIDTGISQGPDLQQTEFVPGYDFINNRDTATDDHGHGTHVAGTIAQSTNNGYGVAGIAYGAKLMPLKVLSQWGSGTISDIAEAIRFAADNDADVINMSLGGGGDSQLMREAIDYAHEKGVVIVAAAGNSGLESASYPALYPDVIGVSAIGPDGKKTSYSNYGTGVDIAAPGGAMRDNDGHGILQETINPRAWGEFRFSYFQGTSMAAPHVAGVAALIRSKASALSADRVWEILAASASPVESDSRNHFGAGQLDAAKAMALTKNVWWDWRPLDWKDIAMKLFVAGVFAWLLKPRKKAFNPWRLSFLLGILSGSVGLFVFRAVHFSVLPDWPLQILGTALPEWGSAIWGSTALNPLFASIIIPFVLMACLISHPGFKWLSLGLSIGMLAFLSLAIFSDPTIGMVGSGHKAQLYLLGNVLLGAVVSRLFFNVALDSD